MSNKYRTKEFLELKAKWYNKLSKEGFEDIEQDEEKLKVWTMKLFEVQYNKTSFDAKQDYYRMATHFLNDYQFETPLEKQIWALHSEGLSLEKIAEAFKRRRFRVCHVRPIVDKLKKIMVKYAREE